MRFNDWCCYLNSLGEMISQVFFFFFFFLIQSIPLVVDFPLRNFTKPYPKWFGLPLYLSPLMDTLITFGANNMSKKSDLFPVP